MAVRIVARIQHHPSRAHLLPDLCSRLEPLKTEVITHESDPPSPWAGYRQCLTDPPKCSHLLVIQDDTVPVKNFVPALKDIARAQPGYPVCLFLSQLPRDAYRQADRAMKRNDRYIRLSLRCFLPVVAVLWPRHKAVEFLEWAEENPWLPMQREPRSDDAMAGRWKLVTRQQVLACVPSIVEHPDTEPSIIGKQAQWGKTRPRSAGLLASDASVYDWMQP